jgi:hypothetical protein
MEYYLILLSLLTIAFLYASVGHGGASGYITVLTLWHIQNSLIRPSVLILNMLVSAVAFIQYYRAGHFSWKIFLPFAVTSIPAAFWGGQHKPDADIYNKILGVALFFPILKLLGFFGKETEQTRPVNLPVALAIGFVIGLVSGMLGIGGGIFLTPVLLLLHWAKMKTAAAVSALFIFVNSLSGFIGLLQKGFEVNNEMFAWIATALIGGVFGSYFGSRKFNSQALRYLLAGGLVIAAFKLLFLPK